MKAKKWSLLSACYGYTLGVERNYSFVIYLVTCSAGVSPHLTRLSSNIKTVDHINHLEEGI